MNTDKTRRFFIGVHRCSSMANCFLVELVFDTPPARDYNVERLPGMTRRKERNTGNV
jgi:hypothetical protein